MTEKPQRLRMVVVAFVLALAWVAIATRLCSLHLGPNTRLREKVAQMHPVNEEIPAPRGRILDARGHIMAMDMPVRNVCIDPAVIKSTNGMAARVTLTLASALQIEPAVIWPKILQTNRYAIIRKYVPVDVTEVITNARLKGVILEEVSRRYYPRGQLACHVIGYASGGAGSSGVERRADKYLRGVPGMRVSERDGRKTEIVTRRVVEIDPRSGDDVYLTVDQNLQYFVEEALDQAIEKNRARGAWAILQRVKTGEILALASRPGFDLNEYADANDTNRLNCAIGYTYEPGSTFKMATIAAALDAGTVSPRQMIDCENGVWIYMGKPLRDFHPHGTLAVGDVLKVSSNIGAAKIALTLGAKRLRDYLDEFGIGHRTGIGLSGEEAGLLHKIENWSGLSISRVPMGHEVTVTSLQILGVLNAIANDGLLVKPQIIDRIITSEGNTIYERKTEVLSRPIRPQTAQLMRKLLTRTTERTPKMSGTGTRARLDGYTTAGKTGTAQKVMPGGGYSDALNIASFVGLAPAEKPELALVVIIDEPSLPGEHTGGVACAPVFKQIMQQALRYLDVPSIASDKVWFFGDEIPTS